MIEGDRKHAEHHFAMIQQQIASLVRQVATLDSEGALLRKGLDELIAA